MTRKHNFSAGPAILPEQALKNGAQALKDYEGIGMSIAEVSHRSSEFENVLNDAVTKVRNLLKVPDDYAILFLQGGASLQFAMAPYNLLPSDGKAAYIESGSWAKKAIKEAKFFGDVEVTASSKDENFSYIPKDYKIPEDASYLHLTSNNTIFGTQMHSFPDTSVPLVADMSSDILSRPLDISRFGLIYAGAQKNLGPAGTTLVIVKKDLLGKVDRDIPTMLDYQTHIEKNSLYNTPPVFPIYICLETLKWIEQNGGLEGVQQNNKEKAELLYEEIDSNPLFVGTAAKEDRSYMNVTFVMKEEGLDEKFLEEAEKADISGIKGHRSVGGFRASIYNAMPKASVEALVNLMKDFAKKHSKAEA